MALRLLLRRNHWKTKKADVLLGSINHRLCHSAPSSTTTGTTLEHHIHVPDTSLTDDDRHASFNPKTQLERYITFISDGPHYPDAGIDDDMIFLAQFAVFIVNDTNTRRDNSKRIEFVRVVSAKWKLVNGQIYRITLEAAYDDDDDGRITKLYEAEFLQKINWLTLMSWRELKSPPNTTQASLDSAMDDIKMIELLKIRAKELSTYRLKM